MNDKNIFRKFYLKVNENYLRIRHSSNDGIVEGGKVNTPY